MSAERALASLALGERAVVTRLADCEGEEAMRLLALGISPGAALVLEQRATAFVVRVEESLVALEAAVARGIFVRGGPDGAL